MAQQGRLRLQWLLIGCGVLLALAVVAVGILLRVAYPLSYRGEIERYSAEYGIPPSLVGAVVHTESRFRPRVVSSVGARGMMQITEETFEWAKWRMGDTETEYDDLFDPEVNIRYGTYILSLLLTEFGGEAEALAAYHAGWGSVKNWLGDGQMSGDGQTLDTIPFVDTAKYVPRVLQTRKVYHTLYGLS